ncbi:MAG: hypothetical protein M1828_007150 [Chrysothrix sp. TS-e1954]|nr:MAG: hypothetical protein M1828_007150 [Chrysothrix sp. TS-e1954]
MQNTVENENAYMRRRIEGLERTLRHHEIDPGETESLQAYSSLPSTPVEPFHGRQLSQNHATPVTQKSSHTQPNDASTREANVFALPTFRDAIPGANYLGVPSPNDCLSQIKGLAVSVFGMELDFGQFLADDFEDARNPTSYSSFAATIMGTPKYTYDSSQTSWPQTYEEMLKYARMYVNFINPWMPVLHRPDFMEFVYRIYHEDDIDPSIAERVIIQMMLAICKYNIASRSPDQHQQLYDQSFAHYHFSLSQAGHLTTNRSVVDFQALLLICIFVRSFPTPGAVWGLSSWILNLAIETGFHRSAAAWPANTSQRSRLEIELRKRIFWTLLMINVSIGGRLGRPMHLRREDYDIEFPEPMDDRLPSEMDSPQVNRCSMDLGIEMMKMTELFLDAYNCVYAIRPTNDYEQDVRKLASRAKKWKAELPPKYSLGEPEAAELPMLVAALWAHYWEAEFQLVLHHPALCRSSNPATVAHNLGICIHSAFSIMRSAAQLNAHKCLDTTWVNATLYIAAIFTLLFAYWERRDQVTSDDVKKLEGQMNICLDILGMIGVAGPHAKPNAVGNLRAKVKEITDTALGRINRHLVEKTASAAVASSSVDQRGRGSPVDGLTSAVGATKVKSEPNSRATTDPSSNSHTGILPQQFSQQSQMRTSSVGGYMPSQESPSSPPGPPQHVPPPRPQRQSSQSSPYQQMQQQPHQYQQDPSCYLPTPQHSSYVSDTSPFPQQNQAHFAFPPHSPFDNRPRSHHHLSQTQSPQPLVPSDPYAYHPTPTMTSQYQMHHMRQQHPHQHHQQQTDAYAVPNSWHNFTREIKDPQAGSPTGDHTAPPYDASSNMSHMFADLAAAAAAGQGGAGGGVVGQNWPAASGFAASGFDEQGRGGGSAGYG